MELLFGYLAGLLTLINPCVLPVLPIVLASALQVSRWGPLALAGGMALSFVIVGMSVAVLGRALGLNEETLSRAGAIAMIGFGLVLLVPRAAHGFELATAGLSARADAGIDQVDRTGLRGQFLGGALLGAVWVPCVGPTLGGAIAMASAGESLWWAAAIMTSFALGIGTVIVALGYGAQSVILSRRDRLRGLATKARPIMGVIFVATGAAILAGLHKSAEIWLIEVLPFWLQDLSVRY